MKILFIRPPNRGLYHEITRYMPIGIAYLASACRSKGHDVEIFDSLIYFEDNYVLNENELTDIQRKIIHHHPCIKTIIHWGATYTRISEYISSFAPDVVCITSMHSPTYNTAYDVGNIVKNIDSNIITIIGGPHASSNYEHILDNTNIDYILQGEGETSLPHLIYCIEKNILPLDVDGVIFRTRNINIANKKTSNNVSYYYKPKTKCICDLDSNVYPAVDLLDMSKYQNTATLITSRGCPYSCSFCTIHSSVGKQYRSRSPQNIIEEIEWYISQYNIRKFNIEDDNFTFDIDRVMTLCDIIIEKNLDIEIFLFNGIMVHGMTEELANKLEDI